MCAAIACDTFQPSAALGLSLDVVRVWDLGNYFFSLFPLSLYGGADSYTYKLQKLARRQMLRHTIQKEHLYIILFGCCVVADFSCFVAATSFAAGTALPLLHLLSLVRPRRISVATFYHCFWSRDCSQVPRPVCTANHHITLVKTLTLLLPCASCDTTLASLTPFRLL